MVAATGFARGRVQREIERYCASPGQACSYKIGHLAWLRARQKAQRALGAKFDLREFHEILREGAMPLTILATQQINEVNGLVLDLLTGAPIPAAKVVLEDSVGTKWEDAGTDDTGYFVYTSTPEKKIAAGNLKITVTREGFTEAFKEIPRGQPVTNLRIPMSPSGSAGPSTSATAASRR